MRVAFVKVSLHGLNDDDGIVDHRTDGEHEGKERQQVETEAHELHEGKGADERHHDAHRGDERDNSKRQPQPLRSFHYTIFAFQSQCAQAIG